MMLSPGCHVFNTCVCVKGEGTVVAIAIPLLGRYDCAFSPAQSPYALIGISTVAV